MLSIDAVCAWCNQDAQGRVVCFRCGAFPATVDMRVSPDKTIKACDACAAGDCTTETVSHGICDACEMAHFTEDEVWVVKGANSPHVKLFMQWDAAVPVIREMLMTGEHVSLELAPVIRTFKEPS